LTQASLSQGDVRPAKKGKLDPALASLVSTLKNRKR
jgi:hypothetical protein